MSYTPGFLDHAGYRPFESLLGLHQALFPWAVVSTVPVADFSQKGGESPIKETLDLIPSDGVAEESHQPAQER